MRDTEDYGRTPREPINKRTIEKNTSEGIALACAVLEIGIIKYSERHAKECVRTNVRSCIRLIQADSSWYETLAGGCGPHP